MNIFRVQLTLFITLKHDSYDKLILQPEMYDTIFTVII